MKFDPIKLNLDGKLFNFGEMDRKLDEKFRKLREEMRAKIESQKQEEYNKSKIGNADLEENSDKSQSENETNKSPLVQGGANEEEKIDEDEAERKIELLEQ